VIDPFLAFIAWTDLPLLFPAGALGAALFAIWSYLQVVVFFGAALLVLYRAHRTGRSVALVVYAALVIAVVIAFNYCELGWDAVALYDRVDLNFARNGLWEGYAHAGTTYALSYPPGTSLTVMWGMRLGIMDSNFTHTFVVWLWFSSFMVTCVGKTGRFYSPILFLFLFSVGPDLSWHEMVFFNNILYAAIWTQLIVTPLLRVRTSPWSLCLYGVVLVWLRPQVEMAAVPVLSNAAIQLLLDKPAKKVLISVTAALAAMYIASALWTYRSGQIANTQARLDRDQAVVQLAGRDPAMQKIELPRRPPDKAPLPSRKAADVYGEAVQWAYDLTTQWYGPAFWLLAIVGLVAFTRGGRIGLAYTIPFLSPISMIVATGRFAQYYAGWKGLWNSLVRLELIIPILAAAVPVALEAELWRVSLSSLSKKRSLATAEIVHDPLPAPSDQPHAPAEERSNAI
jgi:hypothetical protein